MNLKNYFLKPEILTHKRYEILRSALVDTLPRHKVARQFNTTTYTVNSIVRDFRKELSFDKIFKSPEYGRKASQSTSNLKDLIIDFRKKNLSVPDIKAILDSRKYSISEKQIYNILSKDGFLRLPRRTEEEKNTSQSFVRLEAVKSQISLLEQEDLITTQSAGIFCFLPYIYQTGIDRAIEKSNYPGTATIGKLNSILAVLALKLSNFSRYTSDDQWCMDAGLGLFAKLNVLPKATWYSSYSHKVTRQMNISFLKALNKIWVKQGLVSQTTNLDFTAIPYWGSDTEHLNNNWSGSRNKALMSILVAIGQDPDTGIITYGDATVSEKKNDVVLEFLDFYQKDNKDLKYLVFDSKFTTYENLSEINKKNCKFITIRRRGSKIVKELELLPKESFRKIKVSTSKGSREVVINDSTIELRGYSGFIRQVAIVGTKRIKPALIITNDLDLKAEEIVKKYAQRWLVEKEISEQIYFFHLNKVSSSIVIKVDFDLVMTILAHNLYKILANDLDGFESANCNTIFNKFISNSARIRITKEHILVELKKKRNLPLILTAMDKFNKMKMPLFEDRTFEIQGWTTS